ncbi:hypothetical protein ACQ4M3_12910 [Leptolyngbya sp. AN03gr2]|uniref:hypothetical protein n=1 Tax=unclassified Leptolyngbya TaxID=2650499 RepID=UPI003D323E20
MTISYEDLLDRSLQNPQTPNQVACNALPNSTLKKQIDRLKSAASALESTIQAKGCPTLPHKPVTHKRRRETVKGIHRAIQVDRVRQVLLGIAYALEQNCCPDPLRRITAKTEVEALVDGQYSQAAAMKAFGGQEVIFDRAKQAIDSLILPDPLLNERKTQLLLKELDVLSRGIKSFFPTPQLVAQRMVKLARIKPGDRVLEPEAGSGAIAEEIRSAGANAVVMEIQEDLREILNLKGFTVSGHDFLIDAQNQIDTYDAVVANPPFENFADVIHLQQMVDSTKPGQRIVSLMSNGPFFREDDRAQEFRTWFTELNGVYEKIPGGTFATTGVPAILVVIAKPLSDNCCQPPCEFAIGDSVRVDRTPIGLEHWLGQITTVADVNPLNPLMVDLHIPQQLRANLIDEVYLKFPASGLEACTTEELEQSQNKPEAEDYPHPLAILEELQKNEDSFQSALESLRSELSSCFGNPHIAVGQYVVEKADDDTPEKVWRINEIHELKGQRSAGLIDPYTSNQTKRNPRDLRLATPTEIETVAIDLLNDNRKEARLLVQELRQQLVAGLSSLTTIKVGDRVKLALLPEPSIMLSVNSTTPLPTAQSLFLVTEVQGDRLVLKYEAEPPFRCSAARVQAVYSSTQKIARTNESQSEEWTSQPHLQIAPEPEVTPVIASPMPESSANTSSQKRSESKPVRGSKIKTAEESNSEQLSLDL